jgi:DNA topoisomerase-1
MSKYLVIVESPAKAKTIEKYLGKDFHVMASYGHVRDLIPKEGAVDVDHDFAMKYQIIDRNAKHVDAIRKELKKCDALYLAPDPDREGEAIAWHLQQILLEAKALKDKKCARVVFNQITKKAVQEAMENPRDISMDLVNAQQARRALDYLVGFNLSPLLWRKVRPGLSAGRVQSPALRLICEREAEIEKFITQEYWTIHAGLSADKQIFSARLTHLNGEKVEQFDINQSAQSQKICDELIKQSKNKCRVAKITKKERKRHPAAPFTTSTLQQEAARKLGFSAQRTMQIAQQLYEGIDTGEGAAGLITYMRTDSVTLAQEALVDLRDCIAARFGKSFVPDEPPIYKTKAKNAQEAHEAIRPTNAMRIPADIKSFLTGEQFKLYDLVWKRTIASQMIDATLDTVSIDLEIAHAAFRANGSTITNPGFLSVYEEDHDDKKASDEDSDKILPPLKENEIIPVESIVGEQHFTEPPPRFSEASLVKALEEFGIGRPSTYASIIATLKNREYVDMDNKRFIPTDVGRVVNSFLTKYFTMYVDYDFTAKLEDELDAISCGEMEWVPVLKQFWTPFKEKTVDVQDNVKRSDVTQEKIDEQCPKCGKQLSIRLGKRGRFIGCDGYPECDYTRNLSGDAESEPETIDRACPECQSPLLIRHGKYGKFIGCSSYPKCKHIEPLEQPEETQVTCPKCNKGKIVKRKSRRGKIFFSCNTYPDCDYAIWNSPVAEKCPDCDWPILTIKTTKTKGTEKVCPQKECGYAVPYEESESGSSHERSE